MNPILKEQQKKIKEKKEKARKYKLKQTRNMRERGHKLCGTASGVHGYCMKCHAKKEIINAQKVNLKTSRKVYIGQCIDCDTEIYKRKDE